MKQGSVTWHNESVSFPKTKPQGKFDVTQSPGAICNALVQNGITSLAEFDAEA